MRKLSFNLHTRLALNGFLLALGLLSILPLSAKVEPTSPLWGAEIASIKFEGVTFYDQEGYINEKVDFSEGAFSVEVNFVIKGFSATQKEVSIYNGTRLGEDGTVLIPDDTKLISRVSSYSNQISIDVNSAQLFSGESFFTIVVDRRAYSFLIQNGCKFDEVFSNDPFSQARKKGCDQYHISADPLNKARDPGNKTNPKRARNGGKDTGVEFPFSGFRYANHEIEDKVTKLSTYPNPASDMLNVQISQVGPLDIHVFSSEGKQINLPVLIKEQSGVQSIRMQTSELVPGQYFIRIIVKGESYTLPFQKL